MTVLILAERDHGFTWHGFWANALLQLIAATIGGLIAVAGAFLIAGRTFKQQVVHDLAIRRDEDEARMLAQSGEMSRQINEALRCSRLSLP